MTHAAGNLLANSSEEASSFTYGSTSGCSVAWSTEQAHVGNRSTKITLSSGTWHVELPVSVATVSNWQASLYVRFSATRTVVFTAKGSGATIESETAGAVANTWTQIGLDTPTDSDNLDTLRLGGTPAHGWLSGDVIYLDSWQIIEVPSPTLPTEAWRPYPDEAFYIKGDFWSCVGATATFDGVEYSAGDLITATGTAQSGYIYLDNVIWNKTEFVPSPDGPLAQVIQQRPTDNVGAPV